MVRAAQKGEMENPSPEVAEVAATTKRSSVKKFAKTKHKGLPEKKVTKESFNEDYVKELEDGLVKLDYPTYDEVDELMKKIAKDNGIDTTVLHMAFKTKHLMVPDDWAKKKMMEPVVIPRTPMKSVEECWKTHKKVGMKMKGGKLVNDCRPKNEEVEYINERGKYSAIVDAGVRVGGKKGGRIAQQAEKEAGKAAVKKGKEAVASAKKGNPKKQVGAGKFEKAGAALGGLAGGAVGFALPDGPAMVAGELAGGYVGSKIGGKLGRQVDKITNVGGKMRKTNDKLAGVKSSKYQKEEVINEISPANPARIKKENPYSIKNKLKMAIKSVSERNRFKAGAVKESNHDETMAASEKTVQQNLQTNKFKTQKRIPRETIKRMNKPEGQFNSFEPDMSMVEGSLHKWFKGSKSKDGKGGWVNVVTGGTCASDEPGEGTPKCVSSSKRASMTKAERQSAARRKKAADPNQQSKSGAAKPTYVSTDKKKAVKEDFLSMILEMSDSKMQRQSDENLDALQKKFTDMSKDGSPSNKFMLNRIQREQKRRLAQKQKEAKRMSAQNNNPKGAQVIEDFMPEITEDCWDGYEKKGMKTMFGKRYPNCVKKKKTRKEEFEVAEDYYRGQGEKNVERTKKYMKSKGQEGAPGLNAMKARQEDHKARRGVKKTKRDEYGDPVGGPKISKKEKEKNLKKNTPDEQHTTTTSEAVNAAQQAAIAISKRERQEKMLVDKKKKSSYQKNDYEPDMSLVEGTPAWQRKAGKSESGGLNAKGVASYRAANPGSKLKTAVTTKPSKLKKGSKAAKRRKSFCKRMKGMKKKLTSAKTARDPNSRINKSLRKWNCSFEPENGEVLSETMLATIKRKVQVLGGGSNKKPEKSKSDYVGKKDAGAIAKKVLQQKQHNKYVNFLPMDEAKKKCGEGEYYCNDDKKCKPIPKGYKIGYGGYLKPENKEDESNGKKGGSNGNGNGHGGNGNGHGGNGNGGNGGGNGGGE
jgi:hypothetical protein